MAIRLIAIDIDGTLMPTSGRAIGDRTCAALQAAEAAGIEIAIATGRRHAYALPLIEPVGLSGDSWMVSSNGALLRNLRGELMTRRFLPVETARKLCAELRAYANLVFTFDREGPAALVMGDLHSLHGRIARWVEANRPFLTEIQPIERAFDQGEPPIQGMVCGTLDQMRQAERQLLESSVSREMSMHRTEYPARDLSMLDLLPRGCSKGAALQQLAQLRGLAREEVMAIGDNLNDREMLEYAGQPVLMANAGEEMLALGRARGWEQTAGNDDDGVALVLERLLRQAPGPRRGIEERFPTSPNGRGRPSRGQGSDGNSPAAVSRDTVGEWEP